MALKNNQSVIQPNTLYAINGSGYSVNSIAPSIEVIGGAVDIYGSQMRPTSWPDGMNKTAIAFMGIDIFAVIPNYLVVVPNGPTPDSIVISGVQAVPVSGV